VAIDRNKVEGSVVPFAGSSNCHPFVRCAFGFGAAGAFGSKFMGAAACAFGALGALGFGVAMFFLINFQVFNAFNVLENKKTTTLAFFKTPPV
jgi:hypothetical protein